MWVNKNKISVNWHLIGVPLVAAGLLLASLLVFFSQLKPAQVGSAAATIPEAWLEATQLPNETIGYAFAQCPEDPDSFYIIGGFDDDYEITGWLTDTYRYDVDGGTWYHRAYVPIAVYGASAVCYEGKIYYAGGGTPVTDTLYIYDIARDTWSFDSTIPRPVWGAALGAWDGKLYLVGGSDEEFDPGLHPVNQVDVYDIATHTWTEDALPPMPVAASAPGYDQAGPYLYLVGGYSGNYNFNVTATQRLNLATWQWETGPTFSSARAFPTTALTEHYLYASGGDANGGSWLDSSSLVQVLDLSNWPNGSWQNLGDPLPNPTQGNMSNACTEVLTGGEIWSVGGINGGVWDIFDINLYRPAEPCISFGLLLAPESLSGEGYPGTTVDYALTITNTGDITDYFSITTSGLWTVTIVAEVGSLAPGESTVLPVSVAIPPEAAVGDWDTAVVTATSLSNYTQSDSSSLTTEAICEYCLLLEPESLSGEGLPAQMVVYTLTLTNTGDLPDTYDLTYAGNTWEVHLPLTQTALLPGESTELLVHVTIPADALAGASDTVTVTATSHNGDDLWDSSQITTTAGVMRGVEIAPPEQAQSGLPGGVVTYTLLITNGGNITDTFAISYTLAEWHVSLPVTAIILTAFTSTEVHVYVFIPEEVRTGLSDVALVSATSLGDPSKVAPAELLTWANPRELYLPIIKR